MRDISQDLKERLEAIERQISEQEHQLEILDEQRESLLSLLQAEQRRWPSYSPGGSPEMDREKTPVLMDVIKELLADGEVWSGLAIARVAAKRGCDFRGTHAGRSTHFTLMGMAKGGTVESLGNGKWRLAIPKGVQGLTIAS
ncbi:MAG TPA: hypothetical protein VGQ49_19655 [Bryobacteraceae bacterium]|jgi:hypothetical protein|nr:hypothetical protein [Bryobacteraceae bacterium]